jgi:hypothetical protein
MLASYTGGSASMVSCDVVKIACFLTCLGSDVFWIALLRVLAVQTGGTGRYLCTAIDSHDYATALASALQ